MVIQLKNEADEKCKFQMELDELKEEFYLLQVIQIKGDHSNLYFIFKITKFKRNIFFLF